MTTCKMRLTSSGKRYLVDGREVDENDYRKACALEAAEQKKALTPQNGDRYRHPGMFGDSSDWGRDIDRKRGVNGSRYCGQLARFPGDKQAFCRSKKELLEKAKRRGMVEDQS